MIGFLPRAPPWFTVLPWTIDAVGEAPPEKIVLGKPKPMLCDLVLLAVAAAVLLAITTRFSEESLPRTFNFTRSLFLSASSPHSAKPLEPSSSTWPCQMPLSFCA